MACAAPSAFFQNWHSMLLSAKNIIAYPGLIVNPFFRLLKKIFPQNNYCFVQEGIDTILSDDEISIK